MSWDLYSKTLLKDCAQDFVTLLAPGARFVRMTESQFQTREIRTDKVMEAERNGACFLIHTEFQSSRDEHMAERLLAYSHEASRLYKLPVLSCVIYLQPVSNPPEPPLRRTLPDGRTVLWFDYESIELAKWTVEEMQATKLDLFQPLLVLGKDGARREVLEEAISYLEAGHKDELLSLTRLVAGLVFTSTDDQQWLVRRFAMLRDYLREHSWTYQETVQEGIDKGLVQGREQGLEQGRLLQVRENIEAVVRIRFPELLSAVQSQSAQQSDIAVLQTILIQASIAPTSEAFQEFLHSLKK